MNKKMWFLLGVIALYGLFAYLNPFVVMQAFHFFVSILLKVIPVLAVVFVVMSVSGVLLNAKKLTNKVPGKGGIKGWLIAIAGGIISSGPIYMWYPLLAQLREKGVSSGFLACFMYNRAIKIPLLPLLVAYFSLGYAITLTLVMIVMSLIQGMTLNRILRE
jgi:uncharacterized membrane protein YraQ (UPF0718 family)